MFKSIFNKNFQELNHKILKKRTDKNKTLCFMKSNIELNCEERDYFYSQKWFNFDLLKEDTWIFEDFLKFLSIKDTLLEKEKIFVLKIFFNNKNSLHKKICGKILKNLNSNPDDVDS